MFALSKRVVEVVQCLPNYQELKCGEAPNMVAPLEQNLEEWVPKDHPQLVAYKVHEVRRCHLFWTNRK